MLSIGEFSGLTGLSVKALRHYDEKGILVPVEVTRRHCPAQAFVGRVLSIPVTDAEALTDDDVSDAGSDLIEQLHASGVSPSGPFWMALRGGGHDRIELMCCWPVAQALPEGWGGDDVVHGHLPERVELVASWHATQTDSIPENATHPAVVALFDEMADHSIDLSRSEVRQTMLGTDEFNCIVEVAITVEQQ